MKTFTRIIRQRFLVKLYKLLLTSLLLNGFAIMAHGQCNISGGGSLFGSGGGNIIGQSFTTTCSGDVSHVTMRSASAVGYGYIATIKTSCDGTSLGSATTTGNAVAGVNTIVFQTPIHLDAQASYVVEFTAATPLQPVFYRTSANAYSGGSFYYRQGSICYFTYFGDVDLIFSVNYVDSDQDGYTINQGDCDDENPDIHPGATEICNGVDDDCNGLVDDNSTLPETAYWYLDADNDGYYVSRVKSCSNPGQGYNQTATISGDCDDGDDSKWQSALLYIDADGDGFDAGQETVCYGESIPTGYTASTSGADCIDDDASTNARAYWYLDADNDGHYLSSVKSCGSPGQGYNQTATILGDCDDGDDSKWQSALLFIDADGDGFDAGQETVCYGESIPTGYTASTSGTDCMDDDASTNAKAYWYLDADNDGYFLSIVKSCESPGSSYNQTATTPGDCDDGNADVNAGETEICDGIDNNCDGNIDEGFANKDGDLQADCVDPDDDNDGVLDAADCTPLEATKWRNANLYADGDGDGYGTGTAQSICYGAAVPAGYSAVNGDCNDAVAAIKPGATEICGNAIDDNCNGQMDEGCTVCGNPTSFSTTDITGNSATFTWIAVIDPIQWQVQYKTTKTGSQWKNVTPNPVGNLRSVTISSLLAKQNYTWHIRAKCGNTWTSYTPAVSFKTTASSLNRPISADESTDGFIEILRLYPNPTTSKFMLELRIDNRANLKAQIQLVDMLGRAVYSENTKMNNGFLQKSITVSSALAHGTYLVKVVVNDKIYKAQVVYQK